MGDLYLCDVVRSSRGRLALYCRIDRLQQAGGRFHADDAPQGLGGEQ